MSREPWEWRKVFGQVVVLVASTAIISGSVALYRLASGGVLVQFLGGVSSGAVVAYDDAGGCPSGWTEFSDGNGRVLLGAASGFPYRQAGGHAKVSLGIDHLPSHTHSLDPAYEWGFDVNGSDREPQRFDVDDGTPWQGNYGQITTTPAGRGIPHDNMPPYIPLYLCKKD